MYAHISCMRDLKIRFCNCPPSLLHAHMYDTNLRPKTNIAGQFVKVAIEVDDDDDDDNEMSSANSFVKVAIVSDDDDNGDDDEVN